MKNNKPQFKINKYLLLVILIAGLFFVSNKLLAATMFFEAENSKPAKKQLFKVSLMLDTQNELINAVEGKIIFDNNLLELIEINEGGSIIALWIQKPIYQCQDICQINFSGITPGGSKGILSPYYQGYRPGKVFDIIFKAKNLGLANLSLNQARVLLNDGLGTPAQLALSPFDFEILDIATLPSYTPVEDDYPPESFDPYISKDDSIFDGKYFLVFMAHDKNSGIDYYEISEGLRPYTRAVSPYLLKYQSLDKTIRIKAVDKAGNQKLITLPATYPKAWYKNFWLFAIAIVVLIFLAVLNKRQPKQKFPQK